MLFLNIKRIQIIILFTQTQAIKPKPTIMLAIKKIYVGHLDVNVVASCSPSFFLCSLQSKITIISSFFCYNLFIYFCL